MFRNLPPSVSRAWNPLLWLFSARPGISAALTSTVGFTVRVENHWVERSLRIVPFAPGVCGANQTLGLAGEEGLSKAASSLAHGDYSHFVPPLLERLGRDINRVEGLPEHRRTDTSWTVVIVFCLYLAQSRGSRRSQPGLVGYSPQVAILRWPKWSRADGRTRRLQLRPEISSIILRFSVHKSQEAARKIHMIPLMFLGSCLTGEIALANEQ